MAKTVIQNIFSGHIGEFFYSLYKAAREGLAEGREYHPVPLKEYSTELLRAQEMLYTTKVLSVRFDDGSIVSGVGVVDFKNALLKAVLDGKEIVGTEAFIKTKFVQSLPIYSGINLTNLFVEVDIREKAIEKELKKEPVKKEEVSSKPKKLKKLVAE